MKANRTFNIRYRVPDLVLEPPAVSGNFLDSQVTVVFTAEFVDGAHRHMRLEMHIEEAAQLARRIDEMIATLTKEKK